MVVTKLRGQAHIVVGVACAAAVVGAIAVAPLLHRAAPKSTITGRYLASGYGGVAPLERPERPRVNRPSRPQSLAAALPAVAAGNHPKSTLIAPEAESSPEAEMVLAYSAARQKNYSAARDRFAHAALILERPESLRGNRPSRPQLLGAANALLDDALYQHAVCTAALGDRPAAEHELLTFMRTRPESPLLHAAIQRISTYHHGDIPAEATSVWKRAVRIAASNEAARNKAQSVCGPECLAELLRRAGRAVTVAQLGREMHTSETGTSIAALVSVARSHGLSAQGVMLTQVGLRGLLSQRATTTLAPTVIALLDPGHFVLLEGVANSHGTKSRATARVAPTGLAVTVWDPDLHGTGSPGIEAIRPAQFARSWSGVAVVVR